jgi:hypothetical protein
MELREIKAPVDFTELLDLQDLSTQMHIFDYLKTNLHEYQHKYILSFVKTSDEVLEYLSDGDISKYEIKSALYYSNLIYGEPTIEVLTKNKKLFWLVCHKTKTILEYDQTSEFTFSSEDNILTCVDKRIENINYNSYYRYRTFIKKSRDFKILIDLSINTITYAYNYVTYKEESEKW